MKLSFTSSIPIAILLLVTTPAAFVTGRIGLTLSTTDGRAVQEIFCTEDVLECQDGSFVSRDPNNNCEFEPCPSPLVACAMDVKECDDGSFVSRDPANNCEFPECPSAIMCAADVQECDDGSFVSRDPVNNCEFPECPSDIVCTTDVMECNDGSFVSRDPENNCEFPKCPFSGCNKDIKECGDGFRVSRDPLNNCEFFECPASLICTEDAMECPGGSFVSRDPKNDCKFPKCPPVLNQSDCPAMNPLTMSPEPTCSSMGKSCIYTPQTGAPICDAGTKFQCRCGQSGQPYVCSCRGDGKDADEDFETESGEIESGASTVTIISSLVVSGVLATLSVGL